MYSSERKIFAELEGWERAKSWAITEDLFNAKILGFDSWQGHAVYNFPVFILTFL